VNVCVSVCLCASHQSQSRQACTSVCLYVCVSACLCLSLSRSLSLWQPATGSDRHIRARALTGLWVFVDSRGCSVCLFVFVSVFVSVCVCLLMQWVACVSLWQPAAGLSSLPPVSTPSPVQAGENVSVPIFVPVTVAASSWLGRAPLPRPVSDRRDCLCDCLSVSVRCLCDCVTVAASSWLSWAPRLHSQSSRLGGSLLAAG
jgi:hypothetical protein